MAQENVSVWLSSLCLQKRWRKELALQPGLVGELAGESTCKSAMR